MKKIYLLLVLFGAFLLCACEKENIDPLMEDQAQTQVEESALKGAKKGMTKMEGRLPMWARMASGAPNVIPTTNDEQYGVIIFYVTDPSVIPFDWNFYPGNWFAAPDVFWLDEQFIPYKNVAWFLPGYMNPHHYHLTGNGDVLLWIITYDQVLGLLAKESITIPELEALKPLVGHASSYHEVLKPYGGGASVLGGTFNAHGTLETWDGEDIGKFIYTSKTKLKPGGPMTSNNKLQIIDK